MMSNHVITSCKKLEVIWRDDAFFLKEKKKLPHGGNRRRR